MMKHSDGRSEKGAAGGHAPIRLYLGRRGDAEGWVVESTWRKAHLRLVRWPVVALLIDDDFPEFELALAWLEKNVEKRPEWMWSTVESIDARLRGMLLPLGRFRVITGASVDEASDGVSLVWRGGQSPKFRRLVDLSTWCTTPDAEAVMLRGRSRSSE